MKLKCILNGTNSPERCWRMGEVTFLMQGVSCPSPLSCEESLERSPERRLSLGWSRGPPPLAPCRLILTSSRSSWAPRGWPLPGKVNTQSDTHVSIRLLREGWSECISATWGTQQALTINLDELWALKEMRSARSVTTAKSNFSMLPKNLLYETKKHFQHSLICQ